MAINFREAMHAIHTRATEVSTLAGKGDDLSMKVMNYYRQAWNAFHAAHQDESKMDPVLCQNLIASTTEYLHRDLTLSSLTDLQSKFDHRTGKVELDISKMN